MIYTYAYLNISRKAFQEVCDLLKKAGYEEAFHYDDETRSVAIDMHGISLRCIEPLDTALLAAEEML